MILKRVLCKWSTFTNAAAHTKRNSRLRLIAKVPVSVIPQAASSDLQLIVGEFFQTNDVQKIQMRYLHSSATRYAQIIDGRKIASDIQNEIKQDIEDWVASGHRPPQLTVVLVGEDPASIVYVNNKLKAAQKTGITSKTIRKPASTTEVELVGLIQQLNENPDVDGILVQMPLPKHINEHLICNTIAPHKDVDGFHAANIGRFCLGMRALIPCTPLGIMELIRRTGVSTFGKNAVVCGRSKHVGLPIAMLLHADGLRDVLAGDATTTLCHRYTPSAELVKYTKMADILVSATGIPGLIKADMVKDNVCVIDVGITRITDPKTGKPRLVGDVDFEGVSKKASYITPVPGGVGPMTVAMLMKNTYTAATGAVRYSAQGPEGKQAAVAQHGRQ